MIFTNLVQGNLNTQFLGRHIEYYPFTDSTNDDVWELVNEIELKNGSLDCRLLHYPIQEGRYK